MRPDARAIVLLLDAGRRNVLFARGVLVSSFWGAGPHRAAWLRSAQ